MTITIPDALRATIEKNAKRLGFATPEEYLIDLVEHDAEEYDSSARVPLNAFRTCEEVETLIQQGLESGPPVLADQAFWDERRQILETKIAARERAARDER